MEDFRNKWIFMDAKRSYPRLELPTGLPTPQEGWSHEKLTDPRAEQLMEKMVVGLKPDDPKAEKLTGAMIVKEFLTQCLAPLQAHSHPLWSFKGAEDDLRLCSDTLSDEELSKAVRTLLGKDQGGPPDTHLPLYRREDGEKIVAAMPFFNERGIMPPEPSLPAGSLVNVSFGAHSSAATLEGERRHLPCGRLSSFAPSLVMTTPAHTQSGSRCPPPGSPQDPRVPLRRRPRRGSQRRAGQH